MRCQVREELRRRRRLGRVPGANRNLRRFVRRAWTAGERQSAHHGGAARQAPDGHAHETQRRVVVRGVEHADLRDVRGVVRGGDNLAAPRRRSAAEPLVVARRRRREVRPGPAHFQKHRGPRPVHLAFGRDPAHGQNLQAEFPERRLPADGRRRTAALVHEPVQQNLAEVLLVAAVAVGTVGVTVSWLMRRWGWFGGGAEEEFDPVAAMGAAAANGGGEDPWEEDQSF
mmetsp:Transcript_8158/g.34637  ORF Transcript_8158/g.34637 Transcript_8158/m.34637 type:complete len:228 (-) Transcript_8158:44-727(-)